MRAVVHMKIGPYDGPYTKNLMTYHLRTMIGTIIWHEDGTRGLPDLNVGDRIDGLVCYADNTPDYYTSEIKIITKQLDLL